MAQKYEKPVLVHITGKEDLLCTGYLCSPGGRPNSIGACRTGNSANLACRTGNSAHLACRTGNSPVLGCRTGNQRRAGLDSELDVDIDSITSCNEGLQLNDYLYIEE